MPGPPEVDKIVKIYRSIAKVPNLLGAEISSTKNGISINSLWSQRNLETGKTSKFLRSHFVDASFKNLNSISPIDVSNELLSRVSPSEKYKAVLREIDSKQYLEVWYSSNLMRNVDLSALDVHGNVYTDGEFASFEWSPNEKKILYVAEAKPPKTEPFYKRKQKNKKENPNEEAVTKGEEYLFRQDWGEQLVGKKRSVLVEYDTENDDVKILEGIPEDICPAQPVYSPDGSYIVGIAYKTNPRKLGLIYCSNRLSTIFQLHLNGSYAELKLTGKSVKSPKFTPEGKNLIWLQRNAGGPHASAMSLVKVNVPININQNPDVIVDVVNTVADISNGTFYGLYNTKFSNRCWASARRLLLSTIQKNQINSYVIDIDSGKIVELPFDGSQIVLDVKDDHLLVSRRNFLVPDILAIAKLPAKGSESTIVFTEVTEKNPLSELSKTTYQYLDLVHDTVDPVKSFTAIYIGPKTGSPKQTPLILFPHGGPHSASVNNFSLEVSFLVSLGFAVLLVNYRGSLGAGQNSVLFLPGQVGTSDVADCILAVDEAVNKYPWIDPSRLVLCGGSHGGFLVTHLSGQYPDKFKAIVARNPVIDIASMSVLSDIPDWCYVEAGEEYTQVGQPNSELLLTMRKVSPIQNAHKVKAPTLLQVGSKDLRVPPAQATDYYHRLKANGVVVRMNLYDDNHPLGSVYNEIDNLINTVLWIQKYLD